MLTYRRSDQLEVIGHSDSNFTECQDSQRSTSGYTYLLVGKAISWNSAKQTLITSTKAAKFIACYEASNHEIYGWEILSLDCELWMELKYHLSCFVIISQSDVFQQQ